MIQQPTPAIPVVLELSSELSLADQKREIAQQLPARIARSLAGVLHQLGIPGKPKVTVESSSRATFPRFYVHGSVQPYPLSLFQRLFLYSSGSGLGTKPLTLSWDDVKGSNEEQLAHLMSLLVAESVKQRPETLLHTKQVAAYLSLAEGVTSLKLNHLPLGRTTNVLKHLLKLGLSIKNAPLIMQHVAMGIAAERQDDDIAETLAPQLSPGNVTIKMGANYLQSLAGVLLADGQSVSVNDPQIPSGVHEQFQKFTDEFFYELGIRVPDIVLVASGNIKEPGFSIKLNDLEGALQFGLKPDQFLVNATITELKKIKKAPLKAERGGLHVVNLQDLFHRLRLTPDRELANEKEDDRIAGLAAVNPENEDECSIIDTKEDMEAVKNVGREVWDQVDYIKLALSIELRRNAWKLIHSEAVEYELAQLHQVYPELVLATMENIPLTHLTRVLRELLSDEISIRDLRSILELMLTYDYVVADPFELQIFDDRVAFSEEPKAKDALSASGYARHVRIGFKRYLNEKLRRGGKTPIIYELDRQIQGQILAHLAAERGNKSKRKLTGSQVEEIVSAIRCKIKSGRPTDTVILTISEIRAFVRQMVAAEFPNLFVISYDELSSESNLQPIAKISL